MTATSQAPATQLCLVFALMGVLLTRNGYAEPSGSESTSLDAERSRYNLTGMAELGVGLLTLPAADVCTDRSTASGCKKGDSSLMLEGWQLIRTSRRFTAGAGLTLGIRPTTDEPINQAPGIERAHRRGYLAIEGLGRYYPYTSPTWEFWLGATTGLVVLSDTYSSTEGQPAQALVGPRGVTTRTEGFTLGLALGVDRPIVGSWTMGASFRYGFWMLPDIAAKTPFGDEASLTGRNSMFLIGLNIGYRVNLD